MADKAKRRLKQLVDFLPTAAPAPATADISFPSTEYKHRHNFHTLSPTYLLPRAAAIEPDVRLLSPQ